MAANYCPKDTRRLSVDRALEALARPLLHSERIVGYTDVIQKRAWKETAVQPASSGTLLDQTQISAQQPPVVDALSHLPGDDTDVKLFLFQPLMPIS